MTSRLQCLICLDVLSLNESSAVRCGHIFHLHCILQWLELQNALANLEKEKQATAKAKDEINICLATNLLLKEKMKDLELASRFNVQQIKHLESMLTQQLDMEKELEKYKKRLKAAAFYKLLSNMKDEPVLEIDKYINKEGLEIQKFITLLRRQLKDAMKMVENQKEELQENRKKISELQKKLNEHKNLNVALKKELASTRMDSSQTIMNGALEEVIAFSPKQHLFSPVDLDDRKMFPASLIASAYGSTSGNTALMEKVQETTPVRSKCEKASKNELRADIENDMEEVLCLPLFENVQHCLVELYIKRPLWSVVI
ncbi:hypothetical protein DINM_006892 [Dirofilaria immitis]|nr:hypothetical protein [Dirofilaria immitis]